MSIKLKHRDQGFSLLESLIALVVLGVMMTGGLAFFYHSNDLYYRGLHRQMATWVADSRMEEIKNKGCVSASDPIFLGADATTGTVVGLTGDVTDLTHTTGLRFVTLLPLSCSTINEVQVRVVWTEAGETPNSNNHHVDLESYIGQ